MCFCILHPALRVRSVFACELHSSVVWLVRHTGPSASSQVVKSKRVLSPRHLRYPCVSLVGLETKPTRPDLSVRIGYTIMHHNVNQLGVTTDSMALFELCLLQYLLMGLGRVVGVVLWEVAGHLLHWANLLGR